jgi:excisionase family DNA binding protein
MTGNDRQLEETSLLTSAEVGARLKIDPRTVRKIIRSGALRATTVGGNAHIRVSEADLADYLRSNLVRASVPA